MTQSAQKLQEFRSKVYQLLGRAKDATFDLMDAVLVTRNIYSFAELSLSHDSRTRELLQLEWKYQAAEQVKTWVERIKELGTYFLE